LIGNDFAKSIPVFAQTVVGDLAGEKKALRNTHFEERDKAGHPLPEDCIHLELKVANENELCPPVLNSGDFGVTGFQVHQSGLVKSHTLGRAATFDMACKYFATTDFNMSIIRKIDVLTVLKFRENFIARNLSNVSEMFDGIFAFVRLAGLSVILISTFRRAWMW